MPRTRCFSEAAGANALLCVTIPLHDPKKLLQAAAKATTWTKANQALREQFLGDLQKICADAIELHELDTQRAFWRDQLSFQQRRVDQGLDESVTLWQFVEKARQAEFEYQRDKGALAATVVALSRQYGGEAWKQLQNLLDAMLN